MKTILLFFVLALTLISCKKNYTCDCSYVFDWGDGTTTENEYSFEINRSKKKDAQAECDTYQKDQSNWKYVYDCELNQ